MSIKESLVARGRALFFLANNPISLIGVIITSATGISMILFWAYELFHQGPMNPYAGIFLFLMLPTFFLAGLGIIPAGILLRRWNLQRKGELTDVYPQIDLKDTKFRHALSFVVVATLVNLFIIGIAAIRGTEHLDSVQFCGQTCHTVMAPEYAAFVNSPHSRVGCVQCHIGPGASWFVKSKLSGTRQVFAVAFHTYSTPIPSPVTQLRPARETCEQCHWPSKFHGDKLFVKTHFADDEANTRNYTVLMLRIGGHTGQQKIGIHGRHMSGSGRIEYVTSDERREKIPLVIHTGEDGKVVEFVGKGADPAALSQAERRTMDCIDCHNRPTHAFEMPSGAVDSVMASGGISAKLPFIKKTGVELIQGTYQDQDAAEKEIKVRLEDFYRNKYPEVYKNEKAAIDAAGSQLAAIYKRNVFPSMKLTWGTHPNHIGHTDTVGCFRCHDDEHKSKEGKSITQECNACHAILAQEETNPKILKDMGIE